MDIRKNKVNFDLWCVGCKNRIKVGDMYVIVTEEYLGEFIDKTYHDCEECIPLTEDDDEYVIDENEIPYFTDEGDLEGTNESGVE